MKARPEQLAPAVPTESAAKVMRSLAGLAIRLMWQWWPQLTALAVACGVVATTICGSLGVGDAMQRGLQRLALARLGQIEAALLTDKFFDANLAAELQEQATATGAAGVPSLIVPALVIEVSLDAPHDNTDRRVAVRSTLLACNAAAALGFVPPPPALLLDEIAINETLAETLHVKVGDPVVLRLTKRSEVPADNPLGRRRADSTGRRLRISQILPSEGIGQFSLYPSQATAALAVTTLATAQAILHRDNVANVLLAVAVDTHTDQRADNHQETAPHHPAAVRVNRAGSLRSRASSTNSAAWLLEHVHPALKDYGLSFSICSEAEIWRLTSRQLILSPEVDRAAARMLTQLGGKPSLAFLANAITVPLPTKRDERKISIPYSTVIGIDSTSLPVGAFMDEAGQRLPLPGADEIVINRWMADDFTAQGHPISIGDPLELSFFKPETLHGRVEETRCTLRISGITEMRGAAVAQSLVPDVEGITDEKSIADWDPPFPFDAKRVRTTPPQDQDDRYWKTYGTTPKAFVSLAVARRLAGSRFGQTTAWHVPKEQVASTEIGQRLGEQIAAAIHPTEMGITALALRTVALDAARGSTPFGGLFLALSVFIVAAGLLLEWLLFNLLVASRRHDIGVLAAVGWSASRLTQVLVMVSGSAAVMGTLIGMFFGLLWSSVLVASLATVWSSGVVAGSNQAFGGGAPSLAALWPGALASVVVSMMAIGWGAHRAAQLPPLLLLKNVAGEPSPSRSTGVRRATHGVAVLAMGVAIIAAWFTRRVDAQYAVGLFFLSGSAALFGLLALVRTQLACGRVKKLPLRTLSQLAWSGLVQSPSRAFSIVTIVAIAEFLIVAVSAFALTIPSGSLDRRSPTGGWTFIATFGEPTAIDPADEDAQATLGLSEDDRLALAGATIECLRTSTGDDASCTNLFAPTQPVVLGLGPAFITRGGFRFVDHVPLKTDDQLLINPWILLEESIETDGVSARPIPAILDQATAQWALKLGGVGHQFSLRSESGQELKLQIVGLLEPSILQGFVLLSERNFQRMYPRRSGYGMALIDANSSTKKIGSTTLPLQREQQVAQAIVAAWTDSSVSVQLAVDRLRRLFAVQNTFLASFQALGTLGLLLGTVGVAAVQIQGVLERIGALSLLRAIGFTAWRIQKIIVLETLLMVSIGLMVGAVGGCIAVLPSITRGGVIVPIGWLVATCSLSLFTAVGAGLFAARQTSIPVRPYED